MQCAKGLDEVGKVRESGTTTPEAVAIQHTNGVLDIHKSCLAIAEEKVFLAVQTYDLVHILTCLVVSLGCLPFISHRGVDVIHMC